MPSALKIYTAPPFFLFLKGCVFEEIVILPLIFYGAYGAYGAYSAYGVYSTYGAYGAYGFFKN